MRMRFSKLYQKTLPFLLAGAGYLLSPDNANSQLFNFPQDWRRTGKVERLTISEGDLSEKIKPGRYEANEYRLVEDPTREAWLIERYVGRDFEIIGDGRAEKGQYRSLAKIVTKVHFIRGSGDLEETINEEIRAFNVDKTVIRMDKAAKAYIKIGSRFLGKLGVAYATGGYSEAPKTVTRKAALELAKGYVSYFRGELRNKASKKINSPGELTEELEEALLKVSEKKIEESLQYLKKAREILKEGVNDKDLYRSFEHRKKGLEGIAYANIWLELRRTGWGDVAKIVGSNLAEGAGIPLGDLIDLGLVGDIFDKERTTNLTSIVSNELAKISRMFDSTEEKFLFENGSGPYLMLYDTRFPKKIQEDLIAEIEKSRLGKVEESKKIDLDGNGTDEVLAVFRKWDDPDYTGKRTFKIWQYRNNNWDPLVSRETGSADFSFKVLDFNKDGKYEVVFMVDNRGSGGNLDYEVFSYVNDKLTPIFSNKGISQGELKFTKNGFQEISGHAVQGDPHCCPSQLLVKTYEWQEGKGRKFKVTDERIKRSRHFDENRQVVPKKEIRRIVRDKRAIKEYDFSNATATLESLVAALVKDDRTTIYNSIISRESRIRRGEYREVKMWLKPLVKSWRNGSGEARIVDCSSEYSPGRSMFKEGFITTNNIFPCIHYEQKKEKEEKKEPEYDEDGRVIGYRIGRKIFDLEGNRVGAYLGTDEDWAARIGFVLEDGKYKIHTISDYYQ